MRFWAILAATTFASSASAALDEEAARIARQNVSLFDEMMECTQSPDFDAMGFSQGGPCKSFLASYEMAKKNDEKVLVLNGLECLSSDIFLAGRSLMRGDVTLFEQKKAYVEMCRSKVEGR